MDSTTFPWLCMAASQQCSPGQKALCAVISFLSPQLTTTLEDRRGKHFSVPASNCLTLKSEWQAEKKKDIFIILKVCKVLLAHHTPHSSIKMMPSLAPADLNATVYCLHLFLQRSRVTRASALHKKGKGSAFVRLCLLPGRFHICENVSRGWAHAEVSRFFLPTRKNWTRDTWVLTEIGTVH